MLATLTTVYICFTELVYFTLGDEIQHNFITQELDQKSFVVVAISISYSISLVFSYAMMIYPANLIIEGYLLGPVAIKAEQERHSKFWPNIYYYL